MKKFLKTLFHYHDPNSSEAIVATVKETMMMLNNELSIKAQNEIISQVISNTIQIRDLEMIELQNRIKDLNEGNTYLKSLIKK